MGIQINGSNDTISATDGGISISGQSIDNANLNLSQNLNVTGVATVGTLNATQSNPTNINVSGVSTVTNLRATNINLSGITTGLNVSGVTTSSSVIVGSAVTISATGINAPGIGITIASINDGPISGARNRIINGDMRIDQRNAGAATANTINGYTVDRFQVLQSTTGKLIAQQNASSVTPPAGFSNYLGVTSQSAYSVGTSDYYFIQQVIEGNNLAGLAWGTASAFTVTLSFWVRSSLTGTFGGSLASYNGVSSFRSYPYTYSISSANTWEYKTITIAGDSSFVGSSANGDGLRVNFALGVGSTFSGTAGAWTGSNLVSTTGATSVVGTNGATFYITGVQLEAGSVATPFERRSYGQELALCQRYFCKTYDTNTAPGTVSNNGAVVGIANGNGQRPIVNWFYPVALRAVPTTTLYSQGTGASGKVRNIDASVDYDGAVLYAAVSNLTWYPNAVPSSNNAIGAQITVSAEL